MTKIEKKMLAELAEKEYKLLCDLERDLGVRHEVTSRQRTRWAAIYDVCEMFGVKC